MPTTFPHRCFRLCFPSLAILFSPAALAHEGMWLPTLLKAVEGDMRTEGLRLTAEDIYSINNGSLKDAVVLFGGGCTAGVVSTQGLLLTNHHCGHSAIQALSSLEHNYLRDGFLAATLADELPSPGLSATFIVRMEDVSQRMNEALAGTPDGPARDPLARMEGLQVAKEAVAGTAYDAVVRPFDHGNQWFLIVSRTYRDIRLVAAPPSGIGEFGGDTDNWMWPRHTGDFSVFRIWAAPDGSPTPRHDAANLPYTPLRSLAIDTTGAQEGEFAMIFGFPGSTDYALPAVAVKELVEVTDPLRIAMRTASLQVIDAAMASDPALELRYSAKQRRIANGWKKWQGQVKGLTEWDAVGRKRALEEEFTQRAESVPGYARVLPRMEALQARQAPFAQAAELYSEFFLQGAELPRFAAGFSRLIAATGTLSKAAVDSLARRQRNLAAAFFRNNSMAVDQRIFAAQLPLVIQEQSAELSAAVLTDPVHGPSKDPHGFAQRLYAKSIFADSTALYALLEHWSPGKARRLASDPAYRFATAVSAAFNDRARNSYKAYNDSMETEMRTWARGLAVLFPERQRWPDANSTLRLSYGKVEGAMARDGVRYTPFTTLDGLMAKSDPADPEFQVPQKLIDLYRAKDFGPWARQGVLHTCFLASLHTTGGNSGSPVLNGQGQLIGLNFDRTWESTMSDVLFDPARCRNISVDITYVLFLIDKYLGGQRLIQEMELTAQTGSPE
jgi:hypothetical protein